jgi:hypothetical protein
MKLEKITAEAIIGAADEHGFAIEPDNGVTLDVERKTCCAIGGVALLLSPEMAGSGDSRAARMLVEGVLGQSGSDGLEDGFEGFPDVAEDYDDPDMYRRFYAIGEQAAGIVEAGA